MKTVSLKIDDSIFGETEKILKKLKKPRNRYINEAIDNYNHIQSRMLLEEKLKYESDLVKDDSMETLKYVHPLLQDKWLNSNNYNKHSSPEFINYLDSLIVFHKEMVISFKEAGVPMVAGTDAGVSGVVTGFAPGSPRSENRAGDLGHARR